MKLRSDIAALPGSEVVQDIIDQASDGRGYANVQWQRAINWLTTEPEASEPKSPEVATDGSSTFQGDSNKNTYRQHKRTCSGCGGTFVSHDAEKVCNECFLQSIDGGGRLKIPPLDKFLAGAKSMHEASEPDPGEGWEVVSTSRYIHKDATHWMDGAGHLHKLPASLPAGTDIIIEREQLRRRIKEPEEPKSETGRTLAILEYDVFKTTEYLHKRIDELEQRVKKLEDGE